MANQDIQTTIYNGLHSVKFSNAAHRYYVDGKLCPGVTTIMGKVLSKDGLMLWPLNMALKHIRENSEKRTASLYYYVTEDVLEEAAKAHIKRRDAGADTGTIVHGLAERSLQGEFVGVTEYVENEEVMLAFGGFTQWQLEVQPEVIAVEKVVFSHLLRVAGTFDSILRIDGKVYLCDLKTTNSSQSAPKGVYAEYFIQLGAYYYMYEEQRQYELAHGGTELEKIDDLLVISCKKNGAVDTVSASDLGLSLETCMKMWESTFYLYNQLTPLKKKLGGR